MCLGPLVTARATGNWSRSAVRPAGVKPTPLPANSTPFRPPRVNVPLLSASPAICRFSLRRHCVSGQSAIPTGAAANAIAPCNCVIADKFGHLSEKSRRFRNYPIKFALAITMWLNLLMRVPGTLNDGIYQSIRDPSPSPISPPCRHPA